MTMLLHTASLLAVILGVAPFTYPQDNSDDYIDPFDMVNYDSASSQYRENKYSLDLNPSEEPPTPKTGEEVSSRAQPPDKTTSKPDSKTVEAPPKPEQDREKSAADQPNQNNKTCSAERKPCECLEGAYMKQFNMMLLKKFKCDSQAQANYIVRMTLNPEDFAVLNRYVSTEEGSIQDVNEVLSHMFGKVSRPEGEFVEPFIDFEEILGVSLHQINIVAMFLGMVALVLAIFKLEATLKISWAQQAFRLTVICFLISVPWNWLHLYKKASSKKTSEVMKGIPDECRPSDTSWYSSINSWYRATFTFMENECDQYHEALEVDPFWEVSPLQAVAVSFSTFIFEPAGHAGAAISKFFRGLLLHIPIQWALPLFISVIAISILILFMMFGYRIRIPFIGAIEPAERITSGRERELLQEIESLKAERRVLKEALPPIQQQPLPITNVGITRQLSIGPGLYRSYSTDNIAALPNGHGVHETGILPVHDVSLPVQRPEAVRGEGDGQRLILTQGKSRIGVQEFGIGETKEVGVKSQQVQSISYEKNLPTKGQGDSSARNVQKVSPICKNPAEKNVECLSSNVYGPLTCQPISVSDSPSRLAFDSAHFADLRPEQLSRNSQSKDENHNMQSPVAVCDDDDRAKCLDSVNVLPIDSGSQGSTHHPVDDVGESHLESSHFE